MSRSDDDALARVTAERDRLAERVATLDEQVSTLTCELVALHLQRADEVTEELMRLAHEVTGDPRPFRQWAAEQMAGQMAAREDLGETIDRVHVGLFGPELGSRLAAEARERLEAARLAASA